MMPISDDNAPCWAHLTPSRIDFPFSWLGHTPFAMWLICKLSPKVFVELGTHSGNSYFAFCEAVARCKLPTRCFAVDTWQGDEHAAFYDDSVYASVSAYNDEHYAAFSHLLRTTFDEALAHFEPHSIDLLHIDGLHTYEAVKHDFESWLGRMSENGVILFHDIAVRSRGFGVFQLWEEIKQRYPGLTAEFSHSNGLGVLFLRQPQDKALMALLEGEPLLLSRFESLAKELEQRFSAVADSYHLLQKQLNEVTLKLRESLTQQHSQNLQLTQLNTEFKACLDQLHSQNLQVDRLNSEVAALSAEREGLHAKNALLQRENQSLHASLTEVFSSTSWRMGLPVRIVGKWLHNGRVIISDYNNLAHRGILYWQRHGFRAFWQRLWHTPAPSISATADTTTPPAIDYAEWAKSDLQLRHQALETLRDQVLNTESPLLFSIIMPVYNTDLEYLQAAIDSVCQQIYPHWELCICNDASTNKTIRPFLDQLSQQDSRIKVHHASQNLHISGASNRAIEMAEGEFLVLLDHDDLLSNDALFWVARVIQMHPEALLLYSDEDKINQEGVLCDPHFKCDWDMERILGQNFFSHLGVFSRALVLQAGGFRIGLEGSQDYDLLLRCLLELSDADRKNRIFHIPKVLYHWRILPGSTALASDEKPYFRVAALQGLNEFVKKLGWPGKVVSHPDNPDLYRLIARLPENPPAVTLIIPTHNGLDYLRPCIDSVLNLTNYQNYSIMVIDNRSDDSETLEYLAAIANHPKITVIQDNRPFNYSALNNRAVSYCDSEFVLLLNNDTEVINPTWLCEMMAHALRPGVGAVGAKLLYADHRIQHGGVILGMGGVAAHAHHLLPSPEFGYFGLAKIPHQVSAVTAACLLVRRSVFLSVGGLDEVNLPVAFNDVDLCLRIMQAGYNNVWTPFALLYHHESVTRGDDLSEENHPRFLSEVAYMKATWPDLIAEDPFYNINLSRTHSYALRPVENIRLGRLLSEQ
jgi:glycosyltransferase involved in cell wall biosynthesis